MEDNTQHNPQHSSSAVTLGYASQRRKLHIHYPVQFLVVDEANGPADILTDLFARLYECCVSFTLVNQHDLHQTLDYCKFDVLIVGLENDSLALLALLPDMRKNYPDLPVILIRRSVSPASREQSQAFGVEEIVELPRSAAGLKTLVRTLAKRYLTQG